MYEDSEQEEEEDDEVSWVRRNIAPDGSLDKLGEIRYRSNRSYSRKRRGKG